MKFGIMQGRLLPTFKDQYQSHPVGYWKDEFDIASSIKIKKIEFIIDAYLYAQNPILSDKGIKEIEKISKKTGVSVSSICADIFMVWPLQKISSSEINIYGNLIEKMIKNLSQLGGSDIVIPFVDNSKLGSSKDFANIVSFLDEFESLTNKLNINLALETDLEPKLLYEFLDKFKNKRVTVNYDSGNSASLGYSFEEELNLYGDKITNVHIKDRLYNGGPVFLGEGDAELKNVKSFIFNKSYDGVVTFQAFRDDNQLDTFTRQLNYFINL